MLYVFSPALTVTYPVPVTVDKLSSGSAIIWSLDVPSSTSAVYSKVSLLNTGVIETILEPFFTSNLLKFVLLFLFLIIVTV